MFPFTSFPGINHIFGFSSSHQSFAKQKKRTNNSPKMAFGRTRSNKRLSSSNSHVSTLTVVVFVALCVLGVWMLTSDDNVVSPKATAHVSDEPTKPDESTTFEKPVTKVSSGSSEDNPGDLPDDAQSQKTQEDEKKSDHAGAKDYSKESTVGGSYQHNVGKKDSVQENEPKTDDHVRKVDENAMSLGVKESAEEQEKQTERQTQVSEDSTLTQKQNMQQSNTDEQDSTHKQQQDQMDENRHGDRSDQRNKATQKSDNHQQALEEQQQQEEQKEREQQQKANDQQRAEDQQQELEPQQHQKDINQQHTREDQQQQQQESEKSITFSDETKKDPTKQETSEDSSTKQERDDTSQPEKPMSRQHEDEAAKQGEPEQENAEKFQAIKEGTTEQTDEKSTEIKLPNSGIPKESIESKKSWSTQAAHSDNEKQRQKEDVKGKNEESLYGYTWQFCNSSEGADYIPCLDNEKAVKRLRSTKHFQHRERHCPEDPPTCLVPAPEGYKKPVQWPESRDKIWFHNVPHTELVKFKGHQNWVKVSGEFLTFPGGGTQFIHGALTYIDFLEKTVPGIKWGKHTRVVLDVGCGVASFGGYLFERDVLTMSFAPKDEHEAQVQFALERGIPAISAVMGSQRLPFPSRVFDAVHCARCRVPWHAEGGRLLLELDRVLRPGGHFIWSATPVYQKLQEDVEIWEGKYHPRLQLFLYFRFAAALRDLKIWVMNVVNVNAPDTLPIIYERGLFGIYHDWCESFSTYPRTYDLFHADHLFSKML